MRRLLQARGSDLRVHFKNSREAAHSLRGMDLNKAKTYMQAVIDHKCCVPFLRYNGEQQQQQQQRGAQAGSAGSLLLLSAAGAGSAEHSCKSVRQRRKRSSFGAVQQLQSRQRSYRGVWATWRGAWWAAGASRQHSKWERSSCSSTWQQLWSRFGAGGAASQMEQPGMQRWGPACCTQQWEQG